MKTQKLVASILVAPYNLVYIHLENLADMMAGTADAVGTASAHLKSSHAQSEYLEPSMRTGNEHSCRQENPADEDSCTQERLSKLTRPIGMLRRDEVEKATGVCRATIYELMRKGQFPPSVKLTGGRAVRWIEEEVQKWLANRILSKKLTR